MGERILILGGTREAARLAERLVAEGHDVTTSLAGRTLEPTPLAGQVRTGGFGGAEGLADHLARQGIERLVDATHPFAANISANAKRAAAEAGVPLDVRLRPPWEPGPGDRWEPVPSLEAAAKALPAGARVLLALGSQHLAPFAARADVSFVVRMIDPPAAPLPFADHTLLLARPSSDPDEEVELLRAHRIDRIVCRNSGGEGAYAKLVAARRLSVPVTMIERP